MVAKDHITILRLLINKTVYLCIAQTSSSFKYMYATPTLTEALYCVINVQFLNNKSEGNGLYSASLCIRLVSTIQFNSKAMSTNDTI